MNNDKISIFISLLLRHKPELVGLNMDKHGWVSVDDLINGVNKDGQYTITFEQLKEIVYSDKKGRYRFNDDMTKIKACQGHSLSWVEPELEYIEPPVYLYHGTKLEAWNKIQKSGAILKMSRHAVHMQESESNAWKSAKRWKNSTPIVLKIWSRRLYKDGIKLGKTENDVWCADTVPIKYISSVLYNG